MAVGDLLEGGGGVGLGVGLVAGAALLVGKRGRPLLKGAMIGYITATERLKTLIAETTEQMQDLYEEARVEYLEGRSADDEIEIVDVVEDEPPPPPPKRPRAGRGRAGTEPI